MGLADVQPIYNIFRSLMFGPNFVFGIAYVVRLMYFFYLTLAMKRVVGTVFVNGFDGGANVVEFDSFLSML